MDDARIVERNVPGLGKGVLSARYRLEPWNSYPPYRTVVATLTPRSGRVAVVAATAHFRSADSAYSQLADTQRLYAEQPGWTIKHSRVSADGSTSVEVSNQYVLIRIVLDTNPMQVDPADPPSAPGSTRLRMVCSDKQMEAKAFGEALQALR